MAETPFGSDGWGSDGNSELRRARRKGFLHWVFCFSLIALALATLPAKGNAADNYSLAFELKGAGTPEGRFDDPCGVATDRAGNIYVASATDDNTAGRIDVFGPDGSFITQIPDEDRPCQLAVDSGGNLYVVQHLHQGKEKRGVVVYSPTTFEPEAGEISYDPEPTTLISGDGEGVAVNPSNDHLYVSRPKPGMSFAELDSAANGSSLIEEVSLFTKGARCPFSIDVWAGTGDIYLSGCPGPSGGEPFKPRVFVVDGVSHEIKTTLDGTNTPDGSFGFMFGTTGLAVDQLTGEMHVGDIEINDVINQFTASGSYVNQIFEPKLIQANPSSDIAVDSALRDSGGGVIAPTGYSSPNEGYVFVTSGASAANGRVFAFAPVVKDPPVVQGEEVTGITQDEAVLRGEVNPQGHETTYFFEYGLEDCSVAECTAVPSPPASAGSSAASKAVSVSLQGLAPDTTYHFRLVVKSNCNPAEVAEECLVEGADRTFTTYPVQPQSSPCPNAAFRVGLSSGLPDCRAYELVTPPDTNGRIPTAVPFGITVGPNFPFPLAAPGGESLIFGTEGGSLPGLEQNGFLDLYRAERVAGAGWQTSGVGPSGAQARAVTPGGLAADHEHAFWQFRGNEGTLPEGNYLRKPDGTFEPIGRGSFGEEPGARGKWMNADASHIIFSTGEGSGNENQAKRLEPNAPADGTATIYDRVPGGGTKVVSLLPGNVTPNVDALFQGASADGSAVAFKLGTTLYLRRDNVETLEVATDDATFAGANAGGERVFFVRPKAAAKPEEGDLFVFDAESGTTLPIGSGEESIFVNVSEDGSHVYFVSKKQLDGSEGAPGAENFYVWDGSGIDFIAVLNPEDVTGESFGLSGFRGGLGQWTSDNLARIPSGVRGPANNPSRTTPSGEVIVFESRANLTPPYDSDGHREVFRYDTGDGSLLCLSCNPTGAVATSNAQLESTSGRTGFESLPPVTALALIANVTDDGNRVFFQSDEPLVPGDTNGFTDVYQWSAEGIGGCEREAGCVSLISSGRSASESYLYGMTPDGHDVFFLTSDVLTPHDLNETPSIYTARVDGGFPPPLTPPTPCQGDSCQGSVTPPPALSQAASAAFSGAGNVRDGTRPACRKGRRKVTRKGRTRCVKPRKGKRQQHRNAGRGQGRAER